MNKNKLIKTLLIFIGTLSLILGVIGIFIPLLPTTPLLLLSAYCYFRSSKRLYDWLINHKVLGSYIFYYIQYRAIPLRMKISATLLLWLSLIATMLWLRNPWISLGLIFVGSMTSLHVIGLRTLKQEEIEAYQSRFAGEE